MFRPLGSSASFSLNNHAIRLKYDPSLLGTLNANADNQNSEQIESNSTVFDADNMVNCVSELERPILSLEAIRSLTINPPTAAEMLAAAQTLIEMGVLDQFVPGTSVNNEILRCLQVAVQDPDVVNATLLAVRKQLTASAPPSAELLPDSCEEWAALVSCNLCAVCNDALAGPNVLPCSHSFCGSCLHTVMHPAAQLKESVEGEEEDDVEKATARICPTCSAPFTHDPIFQRVLDEELARQVEAVPPCAAKDAWQDRRLASLTVKKQRDHSPAAMRRRAERAEDAASGEGDFQEWLSLFVVICFMITYAARPSRV